MDAETDVTFGKGLSVTEVLRRLRHRLLDLTARNRLLNFKVTAGKALPLVPSRLDDTYRRLIGANPASVQLVPVPDPSREDWVVKQGRLVKPEPKEHALRLGLNIEFEEVVGKCDDAKIARAQHYYEDLAKHFRKLDREARLALEETGANMLYLVLGCLDYTENPESDKVYSAPLVCVPVKLTATQQNQQAIFSLSFTGEEIQENLSLREKLKRDHAFTLPDYPEEDEGIEAYLKRIEKLIERRPLWRVRRSMTLALLSFGNMLLIRDLDPENWTDENGQSRLLSHAVVKQIFMGQSGGGHGYAPEYDLDRKPEADLPLIFDADSSQHSAIVDVMAGKSLVIEGPPGTGKSQTITNIIAACVNAGKTVLFVAEKLTALEVVQRRLQSAGLDPFLLELHSNKTNKRQVLDAIERRLDLRTSPPPGLEATIDRVLDRKQKLDQHARLLNTKTGNMLGLSVHQVLWRAEQHRVKLGGIAEKLAGFNVKAAPQLNEPNLERHRSRVSSLAQVFEGIGRYDTSSPFWGFFPRSLAPGEDLAIEKIFERARDRVDELRDVSCELSEAYGLAEGDAQGLVDPRSLIAILDGLAALLTDEAALDVLPAIFSKNEAAQEKALRVIKKHSGILQSVLELEAATQGKVDYQKAHQLRLTESALRFVTVNGLGQLPVGSLNETVQKLENLLRVATSARHSLDAIAEDVGVEKCTVDGDGRLRAVVEVCARAPVSLLGMRSQELARPTAAEVLSKGSADRLRLMSIQDRLSQQFYLDQEPDDVELRKWILVLREGDAWYRFFQKEWRSAIKAHRTLSREKGKVPAAQRLAELEELADLRKGWASWHSSGPLTRTIGVAPVPLDFPLADAALVAKWLKETSERLESVGIGNVLFDPTTIDSSLIVSLAAKQGDVDSCMARLQELDGFLSESFPRLDGWSAEKDWNNRFSLAKRLLECLKVVSADFSDALNPEETIEHGFVLVRDTMAMLAKIGEIAESEELKSLLGARASTFREDLPAIMQAVRFGQAVSDSHLPFQVKKKLFVPSARSILEDVRRKVEVFAERRRAAQETFGELARFGPIDVDDWLPSESDAGSGSDLARQYIGAALENTHALIPWSLYVHYRAECESVGLEVFIKALEQGIVPPVLLEDAFLYRLYASIAEALFKRLPELQNFSGSVHSNTRSEYAELDRNLVALRGKQISHQCRKSAKTDPGYSGTRVADKTEMSLIQHLLPQARPRIALRDLLRRARSSIQQLKPCFMMGPQAVAQYLHAVPEMFDVVIMDEASQMRPEQAIGAIVRGKQLVVVGDPKQLPPTSFFSRMHGEEESQNAAVAEEAESILDLASSHFRPMRSLRWHYRSRHESLIAFSNKQFYDGKLIVFPSPFARSRGLGVRLHFVRGAVYESQTNAREAAAIVDAVVDHILHTPHLSLGVVALNIRQRDLIAELLEERLRSVPGAAEYRNRWSDEGQDIFVKNLENVQGDERDTIVISSTYGPSPGTGRVHQNFGPISQNGGWRRLNVLFTRAKSAVLLVTSMRHTDIVVGAGTPLGTKALRDYLLYAETGRLNHDLGEPTGAQPESEFEVAVISALQERGYECVPQVGVANFRIDIGVRHPKYPHLFLAAIECDGATYHSGITVRDRDRIRQEILESMGWKGKIWRIWSTEWFRNPKRELSRLVSFLEDRKKEEVDPSLAAFTDFEAAVSAEDVYDPTPSEVSLATEAIDQLLTEASVPEVSVGDHVVYRNLSSPTPEVEIGVLIAKDRFDPNNGIISEASPLGQALIGAVEGEELPFSTPGRPNQTLLIVSIKRSER